MAYLRKRHRTYWACHDLPRDVQAALGEPGKPRRRYAVTLQTRHRPTAEIRKAILAAGWLTAIEAARAAPGGKNQLDSAKWYRAALAGATPERRALILERLQEEAEEIALAVDGEPFHSSEGGEDPETRPGWQAGWRLIALSTGQLVPFNEHLATYIAGLPLEAKTVAMAKFTIEQFAIAVPMVADVTKLVVQAWATARGCAPATVRRDLSCLRMYWRHLQGLGVAPAGLEPFDKLQIPGRNLKTTLADQRRPFEPADIVRLLDEARLRKDTVLADAIEILRFSGCRVEEGFSLKIENVNQTENYFDIVGAKSFAGNRRVPTHTKLQATIARLVEANRDGFLLPSTANKYGDRSGGTGRRFSALKTALGFGPQHMLHSIRRSVATSFERNGVAENVASDILGHEKKASLSYGLYSGGTSLEQRRVAIETLNYGLEVKPN